MAMAVEEGEQDHKFCNEYFVMNPKDGGFWDLFGLLFSCNVEQNKYVDCTEGLKVMGLRRRWILVISILAQKILLFFATPLAWIGLVFETLLNLVLDDSNLATLLLNLLRGKLVLPDKTSAAYRSSIGNIDTRLELDETIKPGDSRYCGALSAMAAKLSYETEITGRWSFSISMIFGMAFMFQDKMEDPELIVVAFRGTEPFDADAWITDVEISWYDFESLGKVHGGFMKALGLQKGKGWPKEIEQKENDKRLYAYYTVREKLREILKKNEKAKVIVTGHSLGGALATLFPAVLALHKEDWILKRFEGVYTFGQPRVGDEKLGEHMTKQFKDHDVKYFRYVYCNDMVPRLPYDDKTLLFKHFGTCIYFNSFYQGQVVVEEPNKNYFSLVRTVPMMLNANWEMLRSFIIGYMKGPCYCEGWFLRLFRAVGLLVPGLSAHGPQDYVNASRLGFTLLPLQLPDPTPEGPKIN
ncbi:Lipase [Macleaya cordata]|uniref:Lipase n=1 Tax=Macleaya cordata TaxID=56857 RepID=A0A200QZF7_MACCD|nr:Lipase [Macleaya cordata]